MKNNNLYFYKVFGLTLRSELALPMLASIEPVATTAMTPIDIRLGEVAPAGLSQPAKAWSFCQVAPGQMWLHIPGVARFLVTDGQSIQVEPLAGADMQTLRLYLLGSCIGALLHQRGQWVIHGNAIAVPEGSLVFAGASGVGKSTLAAGFHQRGYPVLADDLAVLDDQGRVHPGYPTIKLWQDTLDKLGMDTANLNRIRVQVNKFSVRLSHGQSEHAQPLKALYLLETHNRDDIQFIPLKGMEKLMPLRHHTYRGQYLQGLGRSADHLRQVSHWAGQVPVTRVIRPKAGFSLDRLIERIEADMVNHGLTPRLSGCEALV